MTPNHTGTHPSLRQIEADIAASRVRLAGTIDELTYRTSPKIVAKRAIEEVKARFAGATRTVDGEPKLEAIAALAATAVALLTLGAWRRSRG